MDSKKVRELTEDYIFKRVFGKKGNEDILKDLLESILEIQIEEIEVIIGAEIEKEMGAPQLTLWNRLAEDSDNGK